MRNSIVFALAVAFALAGCTPMQKGAGVGAVLGGVAGGVIGHQSGHRTEGAVIGAAAGAVGGAVIGHKVGQKKFCPTCGNEFQTDKGFCDKDATALQWKN